MNRVEFNRWDSLLNIAAFFNSHFAMVGVVGPWVYVGVTQEITFGEVSRCIIYDGDSFSPYDTICSTDIQNVEEHVVTVQYMLMVSFVLSLNAFVITNWTLANNYAEKALPVISLGCLVGSTTAWAVWISNDFSGLPGADRKVYPVGVGFYFTILASALSLFMFVTSSLRLRQDYT
jgi:hypothetical protein